VAIIRAEKCRMLWQIARQSAFDHFFWHSGRRRVPESAAAENYSSELTGEVFLRCDPYCKFLLLLKITPITEIVPVIRQVGKCLFISGT
jgi:hypothetical protein